MLVLDVGLMLLLRVRIDLWYAQMRKQEQHLGPGPRRTMNQMESAELRGTWREPLRYTF